ncbi:TolC family outer membrane protein [Pseudomonadota bacterium]
MKRRLSALTSALLALGVVMPLSINAATLKEAVIETIETNPYILQAVNERRSRDQDVAQARAGYKPDINLMAGAGYEYSDNNSTRAVLRQNGKSNRGEELDRTELELTLRQMIFDGYLTKNEVERHQARVQVAAHDIHGVAQNTGLRAIEVYLELLKKQADLELARDNLDAHKRIYDQIRLRSESGVGRKADMAQIEGRVALARSNVVSAQNNVNEAEANYRRVVGSAPMALQRPTALGGVLPQSVEEAIATGLQLHPTLKSAMADVEATQAQHRAAKFNYSPRFDVEMGISKNSDLDGVNGRNEDAYAMLRMRWNLYNGGKDKARIEQTAHEINEASEVQNNTAREVEESVRLSWTSYEATKQQVNYLKRHVDSAKQTREAYTKQFNIGQRTLLDLLDTENEVFEANRSHNEADYTHLYAQYRILVGMGNLLETMELNLPAEATMASK